MPDSPSPFDARLVAAWRKYDGDACRPERNIPIDDVALSVLYAHADIARCYCPGCVLARAYKSAVMAG